MKILLSAFACDPEFGSDEEVGWRWAMGLAAMGHEVWVLTRASHRAQIEHYEHLHGLPSTLHFVYLDIDWLHRVLRRVNRRNHLYYYAWQWQAYRKAQQLQAQHSFDYVHHVTWVSFRQPSFMGGLGIPMLFGPVAGGDEIPRGYIRDFSVLQKGIEYVRWLANSLVRFDPLMRMTYRQATRVLFTSEYHLKRVPDWVARKASVELAIGCDPLAEMTPAVRTPGKRLLFVGRCIGWKGMDLGLQIFAEAYQQDPEVRLTVIGDGVDRVRWMQKAARLGVAHAIEWKGWLPKQEVLRHYAEFDLLFYPSLRDSGGFVVLEALQCGLPVVCFRLGGPGVVVDEQCGQAISAEGSCDEACHAFASAVLNLLARVAQEPELGLRCRARAQAFSWQPLQARIVDNNVREMLS